MAAIAPPSPPFLAPPPPPRPDALCFAGMLVTAFVPVFYAARAAEEPCGEGDWSYERAPFWLLCSYGVLCAAYAACTFGGAPLGGDAHAFASSAAYVAAVKHALRLAADPADGPPPRAADAALFAAAAAAAAGAAARFARPVQHCAGLFAAGALGSGLFAARLGRVWARDAAPEISERRARRRALLTLGAAALALAFGPACGACDDAPTDASAGLALLDALVLAAATDALC